MNYRMIIYVFSYIIRTEAILMCIPLAVSIYFREQCVYAFSAVIIALILISLVMSLIKVRNKIIYARDGFVIVALSWIFMSLFGCIPFYLSGYFESFIDCFFEAVSGFTTTGATILTDIEIVPKGLLFWRSFTHWIGGMGVLVFILAIVPLAGGHSIHLMRAEVPGPIVGKLVPKLKSSAMILYGIYIFITITLIILLYLGGMPLFDSVIHAFGTAGTGGFSCKNASVGYYQSDYIRYVITIFMILFGINFNMYYYLMIKNFRDVYKNEELRYYLLIILVATMLITCNILPLYNNIREAFGYASFQVASIITTTGYCTADFNLWPELSKWIIVMLMFVGASAGSTGGAMKVYRIVIMFKSVGREIKRLLHPRSVSLVRSDGRVVEEEVIREINVFFVTYFIIMFFSTLIVSLDGFDLETNFTAVVSCIGNVGPGLAKVGPVENYFKFSTLSKFILSMDMLLGRLEIFPIIILFSPSTWKRK